jgi:hypothetical protein
MRYLVCVLVFAATLLGAEAARGSVRCDLKDFRPSQNFAAVQSGDLLTLDWTGENHSSLRLVLNLGDAQKLIAELSQSASPDAPRKIVLKDAAPAYSVYVGHRHGSWEDSYFDNPSERPHEISTHFSKLVIESCQVESDGNQLHITIPGLWMGFFYGRLEFTLYAGSNLVKQAAVVSTEEPQIAYYYDAWLTRCSTKDLNNLVWLDENDHFQHHRLLSDIDLEGPHLKVHRRTLIAEGPGGSLAVLPPPHQYFFARDETINYGNLWYRLYKINEPGQGDFFSFGIRQTPYSEEANKAPLVNAPPGTEQHMAMFWYVGSGSARETFDRVSAYTHDDKFMPLPGRKTFTSHYHLGATIEWAGNGRPSATPEFVTVFKQMGINIAHLMDYHTDGHPSDPSETRLVELKNYFDFTRTFSADDFLLIPGEELWRYFGGHWGILLPKPVYYFLSRNPDQPFEDHVGPDGHAYRIGSAEDMLKMIHQEVGVAWQTHPRTKGSAGFPDTNKDTFFFRDPSWLGGGFKAMPSDYSTPRLGERALNLLDDMNNWGYRKFLIGEVDVFKINHTHELYGHMNINYVKLDRTPQYGDWSSLVSALKSGDNFITTGEILIRDIKINGVAAGGRARLQADNQIIADADLQWTFPLNFCELVWGDGAKTYRQIIPLHESVEFGRQQFHVSTKAPAAKWTRFAVWDTAADGALAEPVRFDNAQ